MAKEIRQILSVSELNAQAREVLEHFRVWVKGEISEFSQSDAWVYNYLTLKDEASQISCLVSKQILRSLDFQIEDGQEVIIFGQLSIYEKRGDYQLKVEEIEQVGKGTLQEQLEKLKAKLQAEGLFAEEAKQPLPKFSDKIGVVSSRDGAAWKDFKKVVKQRWQDTELQLQDVLVQGDKSPAQIVKAIEKFNSENEVDIIVVTRGGGSLEDLWGFNDEEVARAIFSSKIPVVSAVGHEKDISVVDLVADHRSSTPSNAAEEVVPDKDDMLRQLDDFAVRIKQVKDRWKDLPQEVERLYAGIQSNWLRFLKERKLATELLHRKVLALSPTHILKRGYSVLYRQGKVVRDAAKVKLGEDLKAQLAKGGLFVSVKGKSKK